MRISRGYFVDLAGKKSDVVLSAIIFEKVLGLKMEARPPSVGAFANNLQEFESLRDFINLHHYHHFDRFAVCIVVLACYLLDRWFSRLRAGNLYSSGYVLWFVGSDTFASSG